MTLRMTGLPGAGAALALLALGPAPGRGQEPPSPPRFSARVEMVTVEVTVLDGKGQPVPGLARDSFSVFEDGVRQEITAFEAIDLREVATSPGPAAAEPSREGRAAAARAASPWTHVLVIDDLHLTPSQATDVRKAASAFLASVPAGARVVLVATGARVVEDRSMPDGREVLEARLKAVRGSLSVARGEELISDQEAYEIHVRHNAVIEDIVTRRIVRLDLGDDFEMNDPHAEQAGMLRAVTETR